MKISKIKKCRFYIGDETPKRCAYGNDEFESNCDGCESWQKKQSLAGYAVLMTALGIAMVLTLMFTGVLDNEDVLGAKPVKIKTDLKLESVKDNLVSVLNYDGLVAYSYHGDEVPLKPRLTKSGLSPEVRFKNGGKWKVEERESGEEDWTGEFITGTSYYKISDKWHIVDYATTTFEQFNKQLMQVSPISRWLGILPAYADVTEPYLSAGDGGVYCINASWSACHDQTVGNGTNPTIAAGYACVIRYKNATHKRYYRGFFPADTSAIDDGATITSAALSIIFYAWQGQTGDEEDFYLTGATTQPSVSTLTTADFNNNSTDIVSDVWNHTTYPNADTRYEIPITDTSIINDTGYTMLGCLAAKDISDEGTTAHWGIQAKYSEQTGTDNDPKIVVNWTVGGGGGAAPPNFDDTWFR